jgi:hypothetical protein
LASDCWEIAFWSSRASALHSLWHYCEKSEDASSHLKKYRVFKNVMITKQNETSPSFMQMERAEATGNNRILENTEFQRISSKEVVDYKPKILSTPISDSGESFQFPSQLCRDGTVL